MTWICKDCDFKSDNIWMALKHKILTFFYHDVVEVNK